MLKGLPAAYESIVTVLNFGVQKQFNGMKHDLINLANTRCSVGSDVASTDFHSHGSKKKHVSGAKPKSTRQKLQSQGDSLLQQVQGEWTHREKLQEKHDSGS